MRSIGDVEDEVDQRLIDGCGRLLWNQGLHLCTMSSGRSRHSPSRKSQYQGRVTKDRTPRYTPKMVPYTSVDSALDDGHMSHFSLSSLSTAHRDYNVANWLESDASYPSEDDFSPTISGLPATNPEDLLIYQQMMLPSASFDVPSSYGPASAGVAARHAPLDHMSYGKQFSSLSISQDNLQVTSMPTDASHFSNSFQEISQEYCNPSFVQPDSWTYGMPSPPLTNSSTTSDEPLYASDFLGPASITGMSSMPYRHSTQRPQGMTVCEPLGPSLIQPYCGPAQEVTRPRPLRSASEKKEIHQDSGYQRASHSPEENHKPRENPLYEQGPDEQGNYWCPFYKGEQCQHDQPTKQKCIYAKYLDSHLKPYRCKVQKPECQEKVFSSNACLFRHEREAHGLHGHGENPNICWFAGCDRAKPGNGFPRKWNLGDHMKRVHNIVMGEYPEQASGSNDRHSSNASARKRKGSNSSASVQMKRSSSSHAKAQAASASYSRDTRPGMKSSRHDPKVSYSNPIRMGASCNYQDSYQIPLEHVQYSSMSVYPQQSRHAPRCPDTSYGQVGYAY